MNVREFIELLNAVENKEAKVVSMFEGDWEELTYATFHERAMYFDGERTQSGPVVHIE
jgi:hypothetical protein